MEQATPTPVETPAITPTETPTPETAPKVEAAPESDPKFAAKFAALAQQEKRARQQMADLRMKMKAEEARLKKVEEYEQKKMSAKENPMAWLEEGGLTYDDATQYLLNGKKAGPETMIGKLQKEIQELTKKIELKEQNETKAQLEQQVAAFKSDIEKTAKTNTDKWELVTAFQAYETVYSVIQQHYMDTIDPDTGKGEVMATEDALDLVEAYLEPQAESEAKKVLATKKLSKKFALKAEEPKEEQSKQAHQDASQSPTLTNQLSQTTTSRSEGYISDAERKKRAAELLRFAD